MSDFSAIFDVAIDHLGGREAVQKLLSVGPSALSNYRRRGHLPAGKQVVLEKALAKIGWQLDLENLQITPTSRTENKRILLIITGGIAAYKALELARRLMDRGYQVRGVMTASATQFITPLSLSALTGDKVYTELFSLTDEAEMGHIKLARDADLVLVAPATAHFMAKMAHGMADDLASTLCLATEHPVMVAPAMNPNMWAHPATQANLALLVSRHVSIIAPEKGDTACGEIGTGRLADTQVIIQAVDQLLHPSPKLLKGRHIIVTSGPTYEAIDPVRYIANHSSGKQGHALARACAAQGAQVTLVTGPVNLPDPAHIHTIHVQTGREMHQACMAALPADGAICAAAVADWHVLPQSQKIKKNNRLAPSLEFIENPDILASLSQHEKRPKLVVGFAAETQNLADYAEAKRQRKKCDWIVGNTIHYRDGQSVFGSDNNTVSLFKASGIQEWPALSKDAVAQKLVLEMARWFHDNTH